MGFLNEGEIEEMEFHCQGQRASQIFIIALLKEARMRKDWSYDVQNYGDRESHVHKKETVKLNGWKEIRVQGEQ